MLGGTLSALDGIGPDELNIAALVQRVGAGGVREVIVATNATVDGQTTAHYLADRLAELGVPVTRLAHGVPVGGELDWLDDGTLATALKARRAFWSRPVSSDTLARARRRAGRRLGERAQYLCRRAGAGRARSGWVS